jgi:hypothetical protein
VGDPRAASVWGGLDGVGITLITPASNKQAIVA